MVDSLFLFSTSFTTPRPNPNMLKRMTSGVFPKRKASHELAIPADPLLPSLRGRLSISMDKFKASMHARRPLSSLFEQKKNAGDSTFYLQRLARSALEDGNIPLLTNDGTGGVYMISNTLSPSTNDEDETATDSQALAIFKPRDEEFMAPCNPRGYCKSGAVVGETPHPVQRGFAIGNGALMERAAYLMDAAYDHYSGVPATCLVALPIHGIVKEGSLQSYVHSVSSAEDMGTLHFDVAQVQKIGILDVRLFNTDRHGGNILLTEKVKDTGLYDMTPIDHGFCLPHFEHLSSACFDWLRWPQANFPFHPESLDHIASLDISNDAVLLRKAGVCEESILTMKICTSVLKTGANMGLSLYAIARTMHRHGDCSSPSLLENAIIEGRSYLPEHTTFKNMNDYGDALLSQIQKRFKSMLRRDPFKKPRSVSCVA